MKKYSCNNSVVGIYKNDKQTVFTIILVILLEYCLLSCNCKHLNQDSFASQLKYNHYNHHTSNNKINHFKQQRVFLISLGGFRHDYIANYNLKNFYDFFNDGVKASYLDPQFTTQNFPNQWSIVTGSFVETHSIVANKFYDPIYNEHFSQNKHDIKWWNDSEPIWFSAVRQGIKTGIYYWPGSECMFRDSSLYTKMTYNENTPFHIKVNTTLNWFINEDYKFVAMYHNQPDAIAHKYGINSPEFNVTLNQLDESFGLLINQLKSHDLYNANDFNIIVVSDHGKIFK